MRQSPEADERNNLVGDARLTLGNMALGRLE